MNSLHIWSNLWFAPQRDSDLGPDWEGQMTHVSMISLHDYKESKWSLVLSAQEWGTEQFSYIQHRWSILKTGQGKCLWKASLSSVTFLPVGQKQSLDFSRSLHRKSADNMAISGMLTKDKGPLNSEKLSLYFMLWATPFWKESKEWQPCCGTKWNNPWACRYRQGSFSPWPVFFPPNENTTRQVNLPVVQTSCHHSLGLKHMWIFRFCWLFWSICFRGPFADTTLTTMFQINIMYCVIDICFCLLI